MAWGDPVSGIQGPDPLLSHYLFGPIFWHLPWNLWCLSCWILLNPLTPHTTFGKSITKVTPFSNKGPILHRDSISFHLSHQPPLSVMCNFYVVKMSLLGGKVSLSLHKKWHITDKGGWWLKWKLILPRWRIGPLFENRVTFVIDFQKVVCVEGWRSIQLSFEVIIGLKSWGFFIICVVHSTIAKGLWAKAWVQI